MFELTNAKILLKRSKTNNSEIINRNCVTARFRTAEPLWLCKSIEMSTVFMERKTRRTRISKTGRREYAHYAIGMAVFFVFHLCTRIYNTARFSHGERAAQSPPFVSDLSGLRSTNTTTKRSTTTTSNVILRADKTKT